VAQLLTVDDITAGYGRVEVLHGLTMSVPEGSVVALLGPNGAGKTTTLGAISGTVPIRSGTVSLDGRILNKQAPDERARAGLTLIPEGRGVFGGLTVADNLAVGSASDERADSDELAARLDRVHALFPRLRERSSQRAGTLSGGEQQMLALSRALLASPRVLMMDEISMGLAPQIVSQLFDAVAQLKAEGVTMLVVEQYLTYALKLADICYVLAKGEIVFVGEPGELRGSEAMAGYAGAGA
jgi:branched-chain amino acid transport system ATP-binding protein